MRIPPVDGNRESGFTAIEIMIVIAIIGIMSAIAIPSFSTWLPNYRLKSAARDLYSNCQMAKLGAIRNNATWAVIFDDAVTPGRYFICSDDGSNNAWDGPTEMGGDDPKEKEVNFSAYKGSADFGHGNATKNIPGDAFGGTVDDVSYTNNVALFGSRGTANKQGYVYLSNSKGTSYGVGTPYLAGVIVLKKLSGTETWE